MADSVSFAKAVGAVGALDGAIDGSPRPKPKRQRRPPRQRMDARRTFFCRNANCDHMTWSPVEQARHMHAEFAWLVEVVTTYLPDRPEALLLTGGVVLSELTDDECREAKAVYRFEREAGRMPSVAVVLKVNEYNRRKKAGTLTAAVGHTRWNPPPNACKYGHEFTPENTIWRGLDGRWRSCRICEQARNRARHDDRRKRESIVPPPDLRAKLRRGAGFATQRELAELLGVKRTTVMGWEHPVNPALPVMKVAQKYADALGWKP